MIPTARRTSPEANPTFGQSQFKPWDRVVMEAPASPPLSAKWAQASAVKDLEGQTLPQHWRQMAFWQ